MVKTSYSTSWKSSTQPRKQRKYNYNAPLHVKQKMMSVHLSPSLKKKYSLRNLQVKKGDKVSVLRGNFKKKEGTVERVNLKQGKVFISGIEIIKKDNSKQLLPFTPSNLMITVLDTKDKKRKSFLSGREKAGEKSEKTVKEKENKDGAKTGSPSTKKTENNN